MNTRLSRAIRFSFFVFLTLVLAFTVQAGAIVSRSNTDSAGVDGGTINREITFLAEDFAADAMITNVDITIDFEKIGGGDLGIAACPQLGGLGHQGGFPFNIEMSMGLISPGGTSRVLVHHLFGPDGATYTSAFISGGPVTVTFSENADTLVGGQIPVSGAFLPVEDLGFNGESPVGTWTVVFGDFFNQGDPLCVGGFSIAITSESAGSGGFEVGNNMTASFADLSQLGQGINTEILSLPTVGKDGEKGEPGAVVVYWYTFDLLGFPTWAFGVGTIVGDTMVVDMVIDYDGNGPFFGPGFNPSQFQGLPFATITIIWATCAQGTMSWVFDSSFLSLNPGFVAYTMNLVRLTNVSGLTPCI